ncbi:porin [Vitreoscilla massiliensis]|uniref:Porin n=1 Tax=Vitreoscilla massiliensis TaxID=1689272 RepID=A0ABY4DXG3_9NEIS|nr:porin [Vitreoscilla massiliensis]UOO88207.1 porin [Vitreoscilla massiliensis]
MQFKYILGMGLCACLASAHADVVIYGQIKGGIGSNHNSDGGSLTKIEDYRSKLGFKGSEKLGDNAEVVWQVENAISIAGDSSGGQNRWNSFDTFVGVKNPEWGTLKLGYVADGMLGVPNQKMQVDPWESNTDLNDPKGMKIFTRAEKRLSGVRYDAPRIHGVDFNITHQLADSSQTEVFDAETTLNQATVLALAYQQGPWYAKGAAGVYKHQFVEQGDIEDAHLYRVLAGFDNKKTMLGVGFQYMDGFKGLWGRGMASTGKPVSPASTTREAIVTASHQWGRVTPRVAYAHGWDEQREDVGKVDNTSYDQVIVGADYAFSKTTTGLMTAGWIRKPMAYTVADNGDWGAEKQSIYGVGVGLKTVF